MAFPIDDGGGSSTTTPTAPPPPEATDKSGGPKYTYGPQGWGYYMTDWEGNAVGSMIEAPPSSGGGSAGPQPDITQEFNGQWWKFENGAWVKIEGGPGVAPEPAAKPTSHVVNLPGGGADLVTIGPNGEIVNRVNLVPDGPEAAQVQMVNGVLYQRDTVSGEWKAVAGLDVITAEREARAAEAAGRTADAAAARAQSAALAAQQIAANAAENAAHRKFQATENAAVVVLNLPR